MKLLNTNQNKLKTCIVINLIINLNCCLAYYAKILESMTDEDVDTYGDCHLEEGPRDRYMEEGSSTDAGDYWNQYGGKCVHDLLTTLILG